MSLPIRKKDELFTYADYVTWSADERWELIEGVPFDMSPAPSRYHQEILGNLFFEIRGFLKDKEDKIELKIKEDTLVINLGDVF